MTSPATARPRALLSVSDKRGLVELARGLAGIGYELVSTGGTAQALREAALDVTDVAEVTGAPEMLDGRVKTLHPRIAAGVLADMREPAHRAQLAEQGIEPFGLVVVNLYRFEEAAARPGVTDDELIEEIDIGGPTLVRAAAKNHASSASSATRMTTRPILAELEDAWLALGRDQAAARAQGFPAHGGLRRRHRGHAGCALGARGAFPGAAHARPAACGGPAVRREPAPGGRAVHATRRGCGDRAIRARGGHPGGQTPLLQQPSRWRRCRGAGA